MIHSKGLSIDTLSKPFPSLMCMVEMLHNARKICSEFLSRLPGWCQYHPWGASSCSISGAMLLVICRKNSVDYQMGNCPCSLWQGSRPPLFIGNDYTTESGNPQFLSQNSTKVTRSGMVSSVKVPAAAVTSLPHASECSYPPTQLMGLRWGLWWVHQLVMKMSLLNCWRFMCSRFIDFHVNFVS